MKLLRRIAETFRSLGGRREPALSPEETERLTTLFRERYHSFRVLLAANGRALETMARLEQVFGGTRPYGTEFVTSHVTAVAVRVYRMIQHLDVLAPGKYDELAGRFHEIRAALDVVVDPPLEPADEPLVLPLAEIRGDDASVAGGKMANLGELAHALGLRVPPGFVITAAATRRLLEHNDLSSEIHRLIQSTEIDRPDSLFALSSRLRQLIASAEVPTDVRQAVAAAMATVVREVGEGTGFAVRSSAFGEDSASSSFAGLYESQLNVHPDNVLASWVEIAASQYTPQAMVYRHQRGLRNEDVQMAVGCVAMIDATAGGVAYTADPQDPDDRRVRISVAVGLPKTVVDGRFDTDFYVIDRDSRSVVELRIGDKRSAFVLRPGEGIARVGLDEETAFRPTLDEPQLLEIFRAALALEEHFAAPQDVEWAFDRDGRLVVLQARPMQHTAPTPVTPSIDGEPLVSGGVCASPGIAGGRVQWVRSDREALKMPNGAVLVVSYPDPRWAALLDRAAAVVSEHGGIAGHLATVAREFGVPALFGVGSLSVLTRDAEVTVDATGLAVHAGLRPELGPRRDAPDLMQGSPIQTMLKDALALIAPLTLLDPTAHEFRPTMARTLHDIARFCHEMAVREMFSFGRDHRFPRYAAKQLHHNVPMQWWVLDLDDGFAHEITGKYVTLDEITCGPMHALWNGMVAVPWDGPPAVSGSGFASVLFEATRNPALATPFRKPYAQRNYFMVSRHFMNLQSRFGFHFSTVETLAGERDNENYLVFSLKGGAADDRRRNARARFIADILGEHGFRVTVIEDTVTARVSALPQENTLELLKLAGYLLMHTRQLDMIMDDRRAVEHYRAKFEADLTGLGGG